MRGIVGAIIACLALVAGPVAAQDKPPLKVEVLRNSAGSLYSTARRAMA